MKKNRNKETLDDFVTFCEARPELRFWQALMCWLKQGVEDPHSYILVSDLPPFAITSNADLEDTWVREGRLK